MPKPLEGVNFGVYGISHDKASACTYYRTQVPLRSFYDLGLANYYIGSKDDMVEDKHVAMLSADIVQLFSLGGAGVAGTIESIKQMRAGWNNDHTERIYPPTLVFDIDDNIDYVHPFNEAFVRLGTRDYSGKLLKPGDALTTTFAKDGSVIPIWEDKKTIRNGEEFDIERNHKNNAQLHRIARRCDGVTVPSPALAAYYRDFHKCSNVYVYPNSIIPQDYPVAKLQPHEGVRILWQGGGSHMIDWFPLKDAIREICLKYPQVTFVIWGTSFKWVMESIPEHQLEFWDWVDYNAYKSTRMLIDADISLCPLVENVFNKCKSGIKFYEACMPHAPEATLAANVAPYSDEIISGETGMLYDSPRDFVEKLSGLIENVEMRRKVAENGKKWVMDNRYYKTTAPGLMDFYKEIRAGKQVALEA